MKHLISVEDLDLKFINNIFERATSLKKGHQRWRDHGESDILRGQLLITNFFEPSTRTRLSFESAMIYMGGQVIGTENASEFSSFKKGESIADTFRVISGYCDIIVGRFLLEGDARIAADASLVPVINGGDGKGEHPTQALIDLFSIIEKFPEAENLHITFLGDNLHSRTVQSLARLLARFSYISEMNFIGPKEENFEADDRTGFIHDLVRIEGENNNPYGIGFLFENEINLDTIKQTNVVYVTRSQIERHKTVPGTSVLLPPNNRTDFIFTPELAELLPESGLILHPLPRNSELPFELDNNPRSYYFQQAHNGLFVRMALLEALCLN